MLYFKIENGKAVSAMPENEAYSLSGKIGTDVTCRADWTRDSDGGKARSERIAAELNEACGEVRYIAIDDGVHVYPRYDVIELPQIGDKVSREFNGDSYPCGVITSISKGPDFRRITTTLPTGGKLVFHRRGKSATWLNAGTWSLIPGHIEKRNPSF